MLKKYLFLIVGIIACHISYGQEHAIKVVDFKSNETIPFAHVCFEEIDGDAKYYMVTTKEGMVNIPGNREIIVAISFVGYKTSIDTLKPGHDYTIELYPEVFDLDQAVVTASFVPQKADKSIYKVNVINRKDIEIKAANNLSDIMAGQVNVKLQHDAALGTSLEMEGLSGNNVKILVDGVPIIGRLGGNIDLSQLNLYNIDHIEIVEGPMSVVYGSNAMAGAINIITKNNKYSKYSGTLNAYYETVGKYNADFWISRNIKKHNISFSGGRNFFSGYSHSDTSRWQQWKPKEQYNADLKYVYSTESSNIKFQSSFMNERLWSKGELEAPFYYEAQDDWFYTKRFSNRLEYTKHLKSGLMLNLLGSHSFYQRLSEKYLKDLSQLNEVLISKDTTNLNSYMFRLLFGNQDEKRKFSFISGLDFNYDIGTGDRIEENKKDIGNYAIFANLMYKINNSIMVQPGLRYAYNTRYNHPVVPSINIKWQLIPSINIRASYARGFRAPDLKQLYIYFVDINHDIYPNENLKAEQGHNFDLSISLNTEKQLKTHYSNVDLSLFYNDIQNMIYLARRSPEGGNNSIYQYINLSRYNTMGGQLAFKYNYYPNFDFSLAVGETGTLASFSSKSNNLSNYYFAPNLIANFSYVIPKIDTRFTLYYKYTGKNRDYIIDEVNNISNWTINDYNTVDVSLIKKMVANKLTLTLGVKNLLNNTSVNIQGNGSGGIHTSNGENFIGYGRIFFTRLNFNIFK